MSNGQAIRLARQEEAAAKSKFDRYCVAVRHLEAVIRRPFAPHYFDLHAALRDLEVARNLKTQAHKELQSARRVRQRLAGDDIRKSPPVVWLR